MIRADKQRPRETDCLACCRALAGLLLLLVFISATGVAATGEKLRFDIPRQNLASALREFSRQAKQHVLYPSEIIRYDIERELFGYYTVEEGLARLLQDSGLEFVVDGRGSAAIRAKPSAVISVAGGAQQGGRTAVAGRSAAANPTTAPNWGDVAIAEVIVSARRREENLQQVPLAVTAIDSEDIEVRSIQSSEDLNARVPGVAVNGGNFFGRGSGAFRVRGVPGVAVYVDGVVRSGQEGLLMNVVEIERLEILRGPQGTTFGKNAVGGAIQYITQKPRERPGVRAKTTAGSFDRRDLTVNLDLPLSDKLFTKIAAATLNRDGYIRSTTQDFALGDQRDRVVRADLLWRANERFDALLIAEYTEHNSNGTPATVWALNPVCPGDPRPANFVGPVPNSLCIYDAVGLPIDPQWQYGASKQWKTATGAKRGNAYRSEGAILELNWRLNETLRAKSISGYRETGNSYDHDFDGTPLTLYQAFSSGERHERSQELQLLYADARFTGTSGLYYYADENWSSRQNWVANELRFEPWLSARQSLGGVYAAYVPLIIHSLTQLRSEGWAVFSEWTWRATQKFSLSAGARYNHDEISQASYEPAVQLPEQCCAPTDSLVPAGPPLANHFGSATFTELSPRVSLQYQWTPALMTYFTHSQGFGAGGFTGGNVPFLPDGGFDDYGPETLTNDEIGLRADFFGRRLRFNATYFRGDYDNIQITEELQEAPGFPKTTNAGAAKIEGLEIEGIVTLADRFTFNYGATWLTTAYTNIGSAKNLALNSPFAYAPKFAYSIGGQCEWNLADAGALTLRADYSWQDSVLTQLDINTRSTQAAYAVANARLAFRDRSNHWEIAIFGNNLLNEFYRINGFFLPADQIDTGTPARPREWGLSLRYSTN